MHPAGSRVHGKMARDVRRVSTWGDMGARLALFAARSNCGVKRGLKIARRALSDSQQTSNNIAIIRSMERFKFAVLNSKDVFFC